MSYPIPISRSSDFKVYRHAELLNARTPLCMTAEKLSSWHSGENTFHGIPWITPIVGPGCLDVDDGPVLDLDAIESRARAWVDDLRLDLPRAFGDPSWEIRQFVQALHKDRVSRPDAPGAEAVETDDATIGLTLLTALLTWVYQANRALSRQPTSRWWAREVTSIDLRMRGADEISDGLEAAQEIIRQLLRQQGKLAGSADPAVRLLLKGVDDHIKDRRLFLEDVRLLTEVTWLAIIDGSSVYPGWSDLLLKLVLNYSERDAPTGVRPKLTELTNLARRVEGLLVAATERSWRSHLGEQTKLHERRLRLYRSIANLLDAQARIYAALHKEQPFEDDPFADLDALNAEYDNAMRLKDLIRAHTDVRLRWLQSLRVAELPRVPHPTCLITSFDIELEMALWRLGKRFWVILPVLVSSMTRESAELVWLAADVDPSRCSDDAVLSLEQLREGPHEWRVAGAVFDDEHGGDRPCVVRLSGTPLFRLPTLPNDPELFDEPDKGRHRRLMRDLEALGLGNAEKLSHALTVDEYTSLRQSEHEWFSAGQFGVDAKRRGSDLPDCLTESTSSNDRVWVALGVQLDDSAIRGRLFSNLSATTVKRRIKDVHRRDAEATRRGGGVGAADSAEPGSFARAGGSPPATPDVRGIAVNRRIDENEANALHWLGFDLALDVECGDLAPHLEHCARHFEHVLTTLETQGGRPISESDPPRFDWGRASENDCQLWLDEPEVSS